MNTTRLYNSQDAFEKWIDEKQVRHLRLLGLIEDRYERRGEKIAFTAAPSRELVKKGYKFTGVRLKGFKPNQLMSNTSITTADVQANVGITRGYPGEPANENRVKQAQKKIQVWPEVGDTKSVNIRAGRGVFMMTAVPAVQEEMIPVCSWPRQV
jgi:hypothetical protein